LIPLLFERLNPKMFKKPGNNPLSDKVPFASPDHLERVISWLSEPGLREMKQEAVQALFEGGIDAPDRLVSFDLDKKLQEAWASIDAETRDTILINLAGYVEHLARSEGSTFSGKFKKEPWEYDRNPQKYCVPFLISRLQDPHLDAGRKHLVFAILFLSGVDDAVGHVREYLRVRTFQGNGGAGNEVSTPPHIMDWADDLFETLNTKIRHYGPWHFNRFRPEARQKLCLGLLNMSDNYLGLKEMAAGDLTVKSDSDLRAVLRADVKDLGRITRSRLFREALCYILRDCSPIDQTPSGAEGDRSIPEKAVELLAESLEEGSKEFSGLIETSLEIIGDYHVDTLLPRVCKVAVSNSYPPYRASAVKCMGHFLNHDTVPYLLECLKDPSKQVSQEAEAILGRMRRYEEQKRAWQALLGGEGFEGEAASPAVGLIKMLKHEDQAVRLAAIKSLGKLADPSTLPVLVKLMAEGTDEEKAAAKLAVDAITKEPGGPVLPVF